VDEGTLTLCGGIARADSGHDCFFIHCTRVRSRRKKVIVLDRGRKMEARERDKKSS
jgi:hypothetical protein